MRSKTKSSAAVIGCLFLFGVVPKAFAAVGDATLWWHGPAETLFNSAVEIMTTSSLFGAQNILSRVTIVNTSSGVRDVTCQVWMNFASDVTRVTLPAGSSAAPTRAHMVMSIVDTPAMSGVNGYAHLACWINGTSGGVTAEDAKITTQTVNSGSGNVSR